MFLFSATFQAEKVKERLFSPLLGAHCYLKSLLTLEAGIANKNWSPELT